MKWRNRFEIFTSFFVLSEKHPLKRHKSSLKTKWIKAFLLLSLRCLFWIEINEAI